jgi:citrate synthase
VADTIDTGELIKRPSYPTALGASNLTTITLLGEDLAGDVMGTVGFGELAFWLAHPAQAHTGRDSGVRGGVGRPCRPRLHPQQPGRECALDRVRCREVGQAGRDRRGGRPRAGHRARAAGGAPVRARARHHVHKQGDPRTPRLFQIAAEEDLFGPHLSLFAAIGRVHPRVLGKTLPLNGAGVCGAALADLGLPLELLRGFALLARTAGLIGQLAEELRHPVANDVFLAVDLNNESVDPDPYLPDPLANPDTDGGRHG